MTIQEIYIKRCIELAKLGLGNTYPNPLVGSVIVHNNKIIGEGWHHKAGEPHAEVNAIKSLKNKSLLSKSTIYVSLEPCSHFGKTPPCSDLIISNNIKKVVIGTIDPFAKVSGAGIQKLVNAGCDVIVGVLEKECKLLNRRFFTFHTKKRPYIILKWAETEDGYIAPDPQTRTKQTPIWITNTNSRQLVHKWRTEEQAILAGTNTIIEDNPKLTARNWVGNEPTRVVIDKNHRIQKNASVLDGSVKTIYITSKVLDFKYKNIQVEPIDFNKEIPDEITKVLYKHNIQSVIIEGGAKTLQTFIDQKLWDEARVFLGAAVFGTGVKAPAVSGNIMSKQKINDDTLITYTND